MEENQPSSLFEVEMDQVSQNNLLTIAKWGKFISVIGFIGAALCLLAFIAAQQQIIDAFESIVAMGNNLAGALIAVFAILFIFVAAWLYFLFRASSLIKRGLQSRRSDELAQGFKAMRTYFVLSIIFSILSIIGTIMGMLNN